MHVKWKDFCDDIAAVVVPPHLEYDPLNAHEGFIPLIERKERILSPEEEVSLVVAVAAAAVGVRRALALTLTLILSTHPEQARLAPLLKKMRDRFSIREVYVKGVFHDFALSKNSPKMIDHVTRQQFVQAQARVWVRVRVRFRVTVS